MYGPGAGVGQGVSHGAFEEDSGDKSAGKGVPGGRRGAGCCAPSTLSQASGHSTCFVIIGGVASGAPSG